MRINLLGIQVIVEMSGEFDKRLKDGFGPDMHVGD